MPTLSSESLPTLRMQLRARILAKQRAAGKYAQFQTRYFTDWSGFARDCIDWQGTDGLAVYQNEILDELTAFGRVGAVGPRGLGKTTTEAIALLAFVLTRDNRDWKAGTTASHWDQLTEFLWPEIHKWERRLRWKDIGRDPFRYGVESLALALKLNTGQAFAASPANPATIEGMHADHVLIIFDEAKIVPAGLWDSMEGAVSTAGKGGTEAFWFAASTPGAPQGRMYDIATHKPGYDDWKVHKVTKAEALAAGRMTEEWCNRRLAQWGEQSAEYQNHVEGNFFAGEEDAVIPLAWIELAQARWEVRRQAGFPAAITRLGVDVADEGADKTALALAHEHLITELRVYAKGDTMETAGRVIGVLQAHGGQAIVDNVGVGAGTYARVREEGLRVEAFTAGKKSLRRDATNEYGYANLRSEAWWSLRELLDPTQPGGSDVCLPPDDELTGDLTAPHWRILSGAKIQVESKDDIRKRIGRSPDRGDAVVMALWRSAGTEWVEAVADLVPDCPACGQPALDVRIDPTREALHCPHCNAVVREPESVDSVS